jgi:predicted transcriptional regulator/transcriptional regulator with XRE-family HTH domain
MARRLGISTSYLNLVEHGRRPLTRKLLARFSRVLGIDADALAESGENRAAADLTEVLSDPAFAGQAIDPVEIAGAVAAWPVAGEAILRLYQAYRRQRDRIGELGEALRQHDALTNLHYEFRTLVTSIRSLAEILLDNPDLDPEQRRRFLGVVVEDSKRLVPLFGGVFDNNPLAGTAVAPDGSSSFEDVADFLQANRGYFAELEDAAEDVRRSVGVEHAATYERLESCLAREHGIASRIAPVEPGHAAGSRGAARDRLDIPETLSVEARTFAAAKRLAAERCPGVIAQCADMARWTSPAARSLAVDALTDYMAAAILMPYDLLMASAREFRHDIGRLQRRFGVGFEQVCRRLTALQRPGAKGVPFHIVKVDMAGNVIWRFGSSGFRVPRNGGTCPLWNVHAAFLAPEVTRAQLSRMPDGTVYFSVARASRAEEPEVIGSPRFSAIELGCDVSFAPSIAYADGLDLSDRAAAVPVGSTCRLCDRIDCSQRVLPPFRASAKAEPGEPAPVSR